MGWFDTFRRESRKTTESMQSGHSSIPVDVSNEKQSQSDDVKENGSPSPVQGEGVGAPDEEPSSHAVLSDAESKANETPRSTKIISIINQKGGVGKSTTAVNLAAALGEMGKKSLVIDFDPQGNTTSGFGIEKNQLSGCIYDILLNDVPLENLVVPNVSTGVDLVPATINLAGAEVELVTEMARENRLKDAVGVTRGKYDYVFIDCPPSLGLLTVNAFVASDMLIIPIQTEFYALEGVTKLLESVKRVKNRLNPSLSIFGILLTMYDGRTTLSRQVAAEVRNYFGSQVFETIIPRTVKLSEAPSYGIPICQYDPNGKGANAYNELAKEVIRRG